MQAAAMAAEAMLFSPAAAVTHRPELSPCLRNGGESGRRERGAVSLLQVAQIMGRDGSYSSGSIRSVSSGWAGGGSRRIVSRRHVAVQGLGAVVGLWSRNELRAKKTSNNRNVHFAGGRRFGTLTVEATSSSYEGAGSLSGDDRDTTISPVGDTEEATEPTPGSSKYKGSLRAVGILVAILGIGCLAAVALTLNSGGPAGLLSTVSKSGFPAAFALIFVSEIGDKTFFIAALLAMRHSKWLVLVGASGALALMTVISVVIGKLFQRVPAQLQTTLPVGEYAAVALLIWFGLRSIKNAWDIPSAPSGPQSQPEELGELAEAQEFIKQAEDKKLTTPLEVLGEAFTLIFVADPLRVALFHNIAATNSLQEWGDRSMLATIALGAAQSPWGVASGAIAGHVLATLLAVVGGALLARYISEKLIGYIGGFLFLAFAAATLAGVF